MTAGQPIGLRAATSSSPIVGRDEELARITALVAGARTAGGVLCVEGERGIGKTCLLDAAVATAREQGFRVLTARPTHAEQGLPHAVLGDLLSDVHDLTFLPEPQRQALEVVLLRRAAAAGPGVREVGIALTGVLAHLATSAPVLVAIDDAHYTDDATSAVLAFAARRLPPAGVVLVLTSAEGALPVLGPAAGLALGPLPDATLHRVLWKCHGRTLPPADLQRTVEMAGGNPGLALALAGALDGGAPEPRARPPAGFADETAERIRALPVATLEVLAAAGLAFPPSATELQAAGLLAAAEPAEQAGLLRIDRDRMALDRPLVGVVAREALPGSRLRDLHRRLADVTGGSARVWHLGHAEPAPDAQAAAALARAAEGAAARRAIGLLALAVELTPPDDEGRWARLLAAGRAAFRAGDLPAAAGYAATVRDRSMSAVWTSRGHLVLAEVDLDRRRPARAVQHCAEALAATDEPEVQVAAQVLLARACADDPPAAADHARHALKLAEQHDGLPAQLRAEAVKAVVATESLVYGERDEQLLDRAEALEIGAPVPPADSAAALRAVLLARDDDTAAAHSILIELLVRAVDAPSRRFAHVHLAQACLWLGEWGVAERHAEDGVNAAHAGGRGPDVVEAVFVHGLVAAYRGRSQIAAVAAEELGCGEGPYGSDWAACRGAGLRAFLAMAAGDAREADTWFTRCTQLATAADLHEPFLRRWQADHAEALVAIGDLDRASAVLDALEQRSALLGRTSGLAACRRGRALVFAAGGDAGSATAAAGAAVAGLDRAGLPYDRARALLAAGQVRRRFKEKAGARDHLDEALRIFDDLGAEVLAARARRELGRVGVRSAGPAELTETEARVADLAAAGNTTRQIADQLFVSPKTVEANLTRIYRKLGVANRVELSRRLSEGGGVASGGARRGLRRGFPDSSGPVRS
ncbi:AAA family ATPase [Pseudonocardia bannensis]|uniref:AAA family ATPase n=1 Tax=Pseudonocardia bannensis TaxID=630973 RepID=A0A848DLP1_9PSEU|nr:LuxR family transcriptional regulator [Pseudonocardia bannensis]NMH93475.1 AAA family ATPase [Pseudonocardia bannensis]